MVDKKIRRRPLSTRRLGLWVGLLVFIGVLLSPLPAGMSPEAKKVAAVTLLMAIWWISEAVPIASTALVPLILFPVLGVMKSAKVAVNYANHNIFLFMGGLFIAMAMQKWGLHRRIALYIVSLGGGSQKRLLLGFMLATGLISMWISDTATVMMMMPIGIAVILHFEESEDFSQEESAEFGAALMLGIAYAGVIGGIGTLIGTPPNLVFAGMVEELVPSAPPVRFSDWMLVGGTVTLIFLPLTWLYLSRIAFNLSSGRSDVEQVVRQKLIELGPMQAGEKVTLSVFLVAALLWMTRGIKGPWGWTHFFSRPGYLHDSTVAMTAALLLFIWRVETVDGMTAVLDWEWARRIPWRVLLLFGGGFALADGFKSTHLADWAGSQITFLAGAPALIIIATTCFVMTFLTEVTSNTATTTIMMPVLASAGKAMGINPLLLMMPAAMSASCAFMLPVATPGNAIVFGSGYLTIPLMARVGLWLNLLGVIVITLVTYLVAVPVFQIGM